MIEVSAIYKITSGETSNIPTARGREQKLIPRNLFEELEGQLLSEVIQTDHSLNLAYSPENNALVRFKRFYIP